MIPENKKKLKKILVISLLLAVMNLILSFVNSSLPADFDYTGTLFVSGFFFAFISVYSFTILKKEGGMKDVEVTARERSMNIIGIAIILSFIGFLTYFAWKMGIISALFE